MKSAGQQLKLFIGIGCMLFCSFVTYICLKSFQESLVIAHSDAALLIVFKRLSLLVTFILGLIFVMISRGGNMHRTFNVFFPFNLCLLLVATFFLRFEPTYFDNKILLGTTYCYFSIAAFFPVIFTWGFANQNYSFKTASLHYPFLIILLIPSILLTPKLLSHQPPEFITLVLFFLSLIIYLVYLTLRKLQTGPLDEGNEISRSYYGALASLIFFIPIGKFLIDFLMKTEMKTLHTTVKAYQNALLEFAPLKGLYEVYFIVLGVILGLILFGVGKKLFGWINSLLVFALAITGIMSFNTPAFHQLTAEHFKFSQKAYALFLPIIPLLMLLGKELAFIGIPLEKRFTAKLALDILVFTFATEVSRYIPIALITYKDSNILNHAWIYLTIFILCMLAALRSIVALHRGLSQRPSQ